MESLFRLRTRLNGWAPQMRSPCDPCGELGGSVLLGGNALSAVQAGPRVAALLAQSSGCVGTPAALGGRMYFPVCRSAEPFVPPPPAKPGT